MSNQEVVSLIKEASETIRDFTENGEIKEASDSAEPVIDLKELRGFIANEH